MEIRRRKYWMQLLVRASGCVDRQISKGGQHSTRVAFWAKYTARKLCCDECETYRIFWAALLHDVGKLGVPNDILSKAGPLDEAEWAMMRLHPTIGASIVQSLDGISELAPLIQSHQEKFDGSGYPKGLRGATIPLGGRILAVVDAYDAMTSDRVYRQAFPHRQAINELRRLQGEHFDPLVVEAFLEVLSPFSQAPLS